MVGETQYGLAVLKSALQSFKNIYVQTDPALQWIRAQFQPFLMGARVRKRI